MKIEINPSILYKFTLDDYVDLNASIIPKVRKLKEGNPDGILVSNYGGWHSQRLFENKRDEFNDLCTIILDCFKKNVVQEWANTFLAELWFNVNQKGDSNKWHKHGRFRFSGVYYIKAPENSGDLLFTRNMNVSAEKHEYKELSIKPSEGDIYFFPGFCYHSVGTNNSDKERISCSFNIQV